MTQSTNSIPANKFHKISALVTIINMSAKVSDHVETADLTIAESTALSVDSCGVAPLYHPDLLSEGDKRELDRTLVRLVQQQMAEKIEDAVSQLADLGVDLAGNLTERYTTPQEDQLG